MKTLHRAVFAAAALSAMPQAFANAKDGSKPVAPIITAASTAVPIPEKASQRGSKSTYPFASLTGVGMSFGLTNKTREQMSSVVSNANKRALVKKTDETGAVVAKQGAPITDAQGATIGYQPSPGPEMVQSARYAVYNTDPKTDPDKATCRVFRIEVE